MGRAPCCEKVGLKKGPWTPEEDQKLVTYIHEHGHGSWRALPQKAGLLRCGKSCRLRWANYLRPDIKRGKFSVQEEQTIIQLHALLGNRWSAIATHLPKRTDNEIKNYWNTHLKKRLIKMGIDPVTHKPQNKSSSTASSSALVSHMAQWESARLEAESRLVRESKLRANANTFNPLTRTSNPWRSFSSGHGFESQTSQALGLSSYSFDWMKAVEKFDKAVCNWTNETTSHAETSYVGLLQQAMCPSAQATKLICDETKKIVASHKIQELSVNTDSSNEKKPILENGQSEEKEKLPGDNSAVGNSSSARSDVSELSRTDGDCDGDCEGDCDGDGDESPVLKEFQHSSSDEISSSVSFKSHYDGLSTDILMDLVIVPSTCADDRSLSTISGGLCTPTVATDVDDTKDYWSNMFSVCNSPHTNHSGVQSMF